MSVSRVSAVAPLASWVAPALLTPLAILQLGYGYGEPNHVVHLPWILRRLDPTLLSNDWFANTPAAHPNGVRLMTWLHDFVPLPVAFLVFHVLSVFFFLWVTQRIVSHLFGDWRVYAVGLFLFFRWGTESLGNNTLWGAALVPHNVSAPICLLAFYLFLKDKPLGAALACAAATWAHIQLGALTMLVLGVAMLVERRRFGIRRILLSGAAFLVLVAPTVLDQWNTHMRSPSVLSSQEYLYLHAILRQPHHLIPSSWPGADYYRFFLIMALAAATGGWLKRPQRTVLTWCGIIFAFCVIGTVFVEWIPVKLIIRLQMFRMMIFVKFFSLLYAGRFLLSVVEREGVFEKLLALGVLTIQNFSFIGAATALIFALRQKRLWLWGIGLFAGGMVAGITAVATTTAGIPMFWHSFGISPRGLWVGPATLALVAVLVWRHTRLLPLVLLSLILVVRLGFGLPHLSIDSPPGDPWVQFCRLVKTKTPREAVIITPPYMAGIQVLGERAEVANFKCTPMYETGLVEWKQRLQDLSGISDLRCSGWVDCASKLAGGYSRLKESDFLALAHKYNAQYVITPHGRNLQFPEVLHSESFVLYQVPH